SVLLSSSLLLFACSHDLPLFTPPHPHSHTHTHTHSVLHSPNANATTVSPSLVPSLPCPPAAITTNCLPWSTYDIGVACPPAGSSCCQRSLPVSVSNALKKLSSVAAIKVSPPDVVSAPPKFSEPHSIASGYSRGSYMNPKGTSHFNSPLFISIAASVPQGGRVSISGTLPSPPIR